MAEGSALDPRVLQESDFVLLGGEQALALSYRPGGLPLVVQVATGGEAVEFLCWCAQELGLPVLETAGAPELAEVDLQAGREIPEALFGPVADCLRVLHRDPASPVPVRLVRPLPAPASRVLKSLQVRSAELSPRWLLPALEVEIGEAVGERMLEPVLQQARQRLEVELGLILADVRLSVDPTLKPLAWRVRVRGVAAASGDLAAEAGLRPLLQALDRQAHRWAWRLVGYRETEALLRGVRRTHARLVDSLVPRHLSIATLRVVLRNLLREGLPVRDLPAILEAIMEGLAWSRDPESLTERVRASFSHFLCQKCGDEEGALWALLLHPEAEQRIGRGVRRASPVHWLDVDLEVSLRLITSVAAGLEKAVARGVPAIVLAAPGVRPLLRRLLEPSFPDLPVLSYSEIVPLADVRTLALVSL